MELLGFCGDDFEAAVISLSWQLVSAFSVVRTREGIVRSVNGEAAESLESAKPSSREFQ
ncbi:hypothetical protein [Novipirellula rosea]|uniref:hypothetical protein n=1 Tax=Novipirellula rosea TaxID=1031540 RepID=UPI0030EB9402